MKAIVLSSGGIDSTTCLGMKVAELGKENVVSVSVFYGQKLKKELQCADKIADHYGVRHILFDLSEVLKYSDCSLMETGQAVVHSSYEEQLERGELTSYVPFRNGLMLSVVTTLAYSLFKGEECEVVLGCHLSDFGYADCTGAFVKSMGEAINTGTYGKIRLVTPLMDKEKTDVVRTGLELKVPYELTWSCYEGKDKPCHQCGSCIDREKAFINNGTIDPLCEE